MEAGSEEARQKVEEEFGARVMREQASDDWE